MDKEIKNLEHVEEEKSQLYQTISRANFTFVLINEKIPKSLTEWILTTEDNGKSGSFLNDTKNVLVEM